MKSSLLNIYLGKLIDHIFSAKKKKFDHDELMELKTPAEATGMNAPQLSLGINTFYLKK